MMAVGRHLPCATRFDDSGGESSRRLIVACELFDHGHGCARGVLASIVNDDGTA